MKNFLFHNDFLKDSLKEARLCAFAETMNNGIPDHAEPQTESAEAETGPETGEALASVDDAVNKAQSELQLIRHDAGVFDRDIAKVRQFRSRVLEELKSDINPDVPEQMKAA